MPFCEAIARGPRCACSARSCTFLCQTVKIKLDLSGECQFEPDTSDLLCQECLSQMFLCVHVNVRHKDINTGLSCRSSKQLDEVLAAMMAVHQAVLDWQLCLHWVHLTAAATAHSHHLDWWRLATATASLGFIQHPGGTLDARSSRPRESKPGPACKHSKATSRALFAEAYFADNETARQMKSCLSAVSRLSDAEVKALVGQLVEKTDARSDGRDGLLGDPLARLEELVQAATQAEGKAAADVAALLGAGIPEEGFSDEDENSDDADVHLLQVEPEPLRIAGAGNWDMCDEVEETQVQGALLTGACVADPGCTQEHGKGFVSSPRNLARENGSEVQGTFDACDVMHDASPLRIAGAAGESDWSDTSEEDDTVGATASRQGNSISRRSPRLSTLPSVHPGQENNHHNSVQAKTTTCGRARNRIAGVLPGADPATDSSRSLQQTDAVAMTSDAGVMQHQQSTADRASKAKKRKSMIKFQKAMGNGCFSVSGTTPKAVQSCSPAKRTRQEYASASGTAGGVPAALPPHVISSPARNKCGLVGERAGARSCCPPVSEVRLSSPVTCSC
jgi:hypothetical protein